MTAFAPSCLARLSSAIIAERNTQLQAFSSDFPTALVLRLVTSVPSLVRTLGVSWLPKKNLVEPSRRPLASVVSRAAAMGRRYFVSRASTEHVINQLAASKKLKQIPFLMVRPPIRPGF